MQGSSLPVGGESTHAVISGHSGMAGNKMFSDLDQLETGDVFYLDVLGQRLGYEVDRILTVTPDNTEPIQIMPGLDCVTLLTCTPYGINTHRLLVRGSRMDDVATKAISQNEPAEAAPSTWMQEYLRGIGLGLMAAFILASGMVVAVRAVRNRNQRNSTESQL